MLLWRRWHGTSVLHDILRINIRFYTFNASQIALLLLPFLPIRSLYQRWPLEKASICVHSFIPKSPVLPVRKADSYPFRIYIYIYIPSIRL